VRWHIFDSQYVPNKFVAIFKEAIYVYDTKMLGKGVLNSTNLNVVLSLYSLNSK